MKLSELRGYLAGLRQINTESMAIDLKNNINNIKATMEVLEIDYNGARTRVNTHFDKLFEQLRFVENELNDFMDKLEQDLKDKDQAYINLSQAIYESTEKDSADYVLERAKTNTMMRDKDAFNYFIDRMKPYIDWRFAGLHIRPGNGAITDWMKGCDPLYLVDHTKEHFKDVEEEFNPAYQNRLRYYTCEDAISDPLETLPKEQFGIIVVYDFFNYKTLDIVERYLRSCFDLLTGGGTLMFTFNNGDTNQGLIRTENNFACHQPARMIVDILNSIGYEILFTCDQYPDVSWMEVKKPGVLTTLRGGQTLAEIRSLALP